MPFTLADAEALSPKSIRTGIIQEISDTTGNGNYISTEVFPLYEMGAAEETYHRLGNLRSPAPVSSLAAESPIADIEALEPNQMTVETIKEKISPEKGVNAVVNSQKEIFDVYQYVKSSLRVDLERARSFMTWRHYGNTPGIIGKDGLTKHPEIPSDHVVTGTDMSDTANSDPHSAFMEAARAISEDGSFDQMIKPRVDAYVPTSVLWDLKDNDSLEGRFSGVDVQNINNIDQLTEVLPISGRVREIRTKVPRTNSNGEVVDESGNTTDIENAAEDNILEPYDVSGDAKVRNIVLGAFGPQTAVQGWWLDRLADHIGAAPSGQWDVDMTNGFLVQRWTQHDPAISWAKIASETGFEVLRGENLAVIQNV